MESTLKIISQSLNIPEHIILGKCRKREYVLARQILATVESKNHTLKDVGDFIGGRDHTTIIHSRDTIKDYVDTDDSKLNTALLKLPAYFGDICRGKTVYSFPKIISLQTIKNKIQCQN